MKAALSLAALSLAGGALAEVREAWYNISYIEDVNLTGDFSRRVISVNGTFPPPPVHLNQGDTLKVHAFNGLGDTPTTVHHHGMYFPNASWSDGANMISQCPIPPGETFDYEITTENQPPGTYWWHSHYNGQLVDGFRAPLIIHANEEPHQYDEEYTIMLADWYSREFPDLLVEFLNIYNPTGAEPVPQTALIKVANNDTWAEGWNSEANLNFEPGKTYRLRLINMASLSMFHVWLDGHDMRVIEADGISTEEFPTDYLSLGVAQRYSVLVTARNDTDQNYYFHADFNPDMFDAVPDDLALNYTANIIYDESADFAESTLLPTYKAFDDTQLVPTETLALEPADVVYNMSITFETRTNGQNMGVFNDVPFNDAKTPLTLVALNMGEDATNPGVYGNPVNNIVLPYNKTVEVTLWNTDTGAHPFHLHGHHYQIAKRVGNYSDPSIDVSIDESQSNPMRRDTVQVEGGGYVTYRFKSWNPGTWIMHCHISWHLASGLALTMIEAPLEMQEWQPDVPDFFKDQCKAGGFSTEGNAAGHSGTNLAGLPTGPWPQWPTYGWTPKAIGALAGCIITAILGVLTVVWYSFGGEISEADMLAEVKAAAEAKAAKAKSGGFTSLFRGRTTTA